MKGSPYICQVDSGVIVNVINSKHINNAKTEKCNT